MLLQFSSTLFQQQNGGPRAEPYSKEMDLVAASIRAVRPCTMAFGTARGQHRMGVHQNADS